MHVKSLLILIYVYRSQCEFRKGRFTTPACFEFLRFRVKCMNVFFCGVFLDFDQTSTSLSISSQAINSSAASLKHISGFGSNGHNEIKR